MRQRGEPFQMTVRAALLWVAVLSGGWGFILGYIFKSMEGK